MAATAAAAATVAVAEPAAWLLRHNFNAQDLRSRRQKPWPKITAMECAIVEGNLDMTQWIFSVLQSALQTDDVQDESWVALACYHGHETVALWLLHHATASWLQDAVRWRIVFLPSDDGRSALATASHAGFVAVCQGIHDIIVNKPVEDQEQRRRWHTYVQKANTSGRAPLHWACEEGHLPVCKWLVDHGAPVDGDGGRSATPLQLAASRGKVEVCQWLIGQNALPCDDEAIRMQLRCQGGHRLALHDALEAWAADAPAFQAFSDAVLRPPAVAGRAPTCRRGRGGRSQDISEDALRHVATFLFLGAPVRTVSLIHHVLRLNAAVTAAARGY